MGTWDLADVTVVADVGMISVDNKKELEQADLSYIFVAKTPEVPYVSGKRRQDNPGRGDEHDQIWVARDPGHARSGRKQSWTIYHYSAGRARRTGKGIDEQLKKVQRIAAGKSSVQKNRYI